MNSLPPGLILIVGSLIAAVLRGRLQQAVLLLLPILSALHLIFFLPDGTSIALALFGYELMPIHVDKLSLVWGYVFHVAAILSVLYAINVKDTLQHVAALMYAGAAIGAVFAGDLITLFVYWELTAVSSVFLVWASRSEKSYHSGLRYLIVQVGSGVLLLSGILLHFRDTSSLAFVDAFHSLLPSHEGLYLGLNSPGTLLIFLAFGIKAAFPLLHNWLIDAYPEATPTGTVFLSAFTTKLAIYALARGFPGTELLIYIGAIMTAFPIFFAVIENDLRRVLSYSLIVQLGFMVVGVGLANFEKHHEVAELAMNGTAAHAFAHVLYKALLFMSMGAVLMRTGTAKASELGGLYKSMPWTTVFCIIGAASLAAFPLFSGFVTKSLILSAAAEEHHKVVWLVMLFASASVLIYSAIRVPFFAFFDSDCGKRVEEAPLNMLVAMGIAAAMCIGIGVVPGALYSILPYPGIEGAYSAGHVITQLQLLSWSALAFALLKRFGILAREVRSINLDFDWFFRRPFLRVAGRESSLAECLFAFLVGVRRRFDSGVSMMFDWERNILRRLLGSQGKTRSISAMVVWAALLLTAYLVLYYINV